MDLQASLALGLSRHLFHPGVAQFAFGFYSVMLTSTVLGLITMALSGPCWCVLPHGDHDPADLQGQCPKQEYAP